MSSVFNSLFDSRPAGPGFEKQRGSVTREHPWATPRVSWIHCIGRSGSQPGVAHCADEKAEAYGGQVSCLRRTAGEDAPHVPGSRCVDLSGWELGPEACASQARGALGSLWLRQGPPVLWAVGFRKPGGGGGAGKGQDGPYLRCNSLGVGRVSSAGFPCNQGCAAAEPSPRPRSRSTRQRAPSPPPAGAGGHRERPASRAPPGGPGPALWLAGAVHLSPGVRGRPLLHRAGGAVGASLPLWPPCSVCVAGGQGWPCEATDWAPWTRQPPAPLLRAPVSAADPPPAAGAHGASHTQPGASQLAFDPLPRHPSPLPCRKASPYFEPWPKLCPSSLGLQPSLLSRPRGAA